MTISIISVSSDSFEESVGTPAGRVILFGTIPTAIHDTTPTISPPATHTDTTEIPTIAPTIPLSPDYTQASLDYSPISDTYDTHDRPPLPTHGTPFTEITSSTERSPVIPRHRRVGPLPVQQLVVGHLVDHSSSDYFSPDDSTRDSSLDSSSEASSNFHSDASSDSSLRHSLSDYSSPDLPSTSAGPSRKKRRSPMIVVSALSPAFGALSPVCADLIPSPKRVRDSEKDIEPEIQAEIDEYIAYTDALRDRDINTRVVVEPGDREESEMGTRGPVEVRVERVM
nr:hypothetical protein [Tanacetum cinerariifolium]